MQPPQPASRSLLFMISEIERGSVKVPQFQRDFVWSKEKSAQLMDSLLRGFPPGTFILWKTNEQLRSVRGLGDAKLPSTPTGDSVQYVLDGQQRLTSLFATLKGLNVERAGRLDDFGEMYVDLAADSDEVLVFTDVSHKQPQAHISVSDLINRDFDEMDVSSQYREKVKNYKQIISSYQCSVVDVLEAKIDTATEIFTRINITGKPLSVFEIMVAKTFDYDLDFDLGEKARNLPEELTDRDYGTIQDIIFLQVISAIIAKECAKKDILLLNKQDVHRHVG